MKAEIIAIGTELLLGDVINSNAAWISQRLAELGVDVFHHSTVGDNPERIRQIINEATERADLLIFTGGLGPTDDDLTISTLASHFNAELIRDADSVAVMQEIFHKRGLLMPESNLKQADLPQGAMAIKNPLGTAPGLCWEVQTEQRKPIFILAFPGVPKELYAMWPEAIKHIQQWQANRGENSGTLVTRYLHFTGISESKLNEMLSDLMTQANPTVAPYVGHGDIRIRIAAKAADTSEAERLIEPVKMDILQRAEAFYFGDDDTTLEGCIAELLTQKGLSLSLAESCTGGLISNRLTDIPGSSAFTFINFVTYGNMEKIHFVDVHPDTLSKYGAVSPQVAAEMAIGVQGKSKSSIGLSVTGIAGPGGDSGDKPIGLAYLGLYSPSHHHPETGPSPVIVKTIRVNGKHSRKDVKFWFSQTALYYLLLFLRGKLISDFPELGQNNGV